MLFYCRTAVLCHVWLYGYFLTVVSSVVAMTKKNANAALVYSFLYKIVQVHPVS